eukprot:TRINITY_DN9282_c0_g2_i4.p1 TRINITY_DN9282_c0_g2~~TRINITY_DN9282_c0_g2_i4.p1  ORF type:complete len:1250 (+),score=525.50 TRINITY_DN9282_c0_g2_i4:62-3751(+)
MDGGTEAYGLAVAGYTGEADRSAAASGSPSGTPKASPAHAALSASSAQRSPAGASVVSRGGDEKAALRLLEGVAQTPSQAPGPSNRVVQITPVVMNIEPPRYAQPIRQPRRSASFPALTEFRGAGGSPALQANASGSRSALPEIHPSPGQGPRSREQTPQKQELPPASGDWDHVPRREVSGAATIVGDAVQRLMGTMESSKSIWGEKTGETEGPLKRALQKQRDVKKLDEDYSARLRHVRQNAEEQQRLIAEIAASAFGKQAGEVLPILQRKTEATAALEVLRVEELQLKDDWKYRRQVLQMTEEEERSFRTFTLRRGVTNAATVARKRGSRALQKEKRESARSRLRSQREAGLAAQQKLKDAEEARKAREEMCERLADSVRALKMQIAEAEARAALLSDTDPEEAGVKIDLLAQRAALTQQLLELQEDLDFEERALKEPESPHLLEDEKRALRGMQAAQRLREKQKEQEKTRPRLEPKLATSPRQQERDQATSLRLSRDKQEFGRQAQLHHRAEVTELRKEDYKLKRSLADLNAKQGKLAKKGTFAGLGRKGTGIGDAIQQAFETNQRLMEEKAELLLHRQQISEEIEMLKEQLQDDEQLAELTADEKQTLRNAEAWRRQRDKRLEQKGKEREAEMRIHRLQGKTKSQLQELWHAGQRKDSGGAEVSPENGELQAAQSVRKIVVKGVAVEVKVETTEQALEKLARKVSLRGSIKRSSASGIAPPRARAKSSQGWFGGKKPPPAQRSSKAKSGGWFGKRKTLSSPQPSGLSPPTRPLGGKELAQMRGAVGDRKASWNVLPRTESVVSTTSAPPELTEEEQNRMPKMLFVRFRQVLVAAIRDGEPYTFDLDAERDLLLMEHKDGDGGGDSDSSESEGEVSPIHKTEDLVLNVSLPSPRRTPKKSARSSVVCFTNGSPTNRSQPSIRRGPDGQASYEFADEDEEIETLLLSMTRPAVYGSNYTLRTPVSAPQSARSNSADVHVFGDGRRCDLCPDSRAFVEVDHVLWPSVHHFYAAQRFTLPRDEAGDLRRVPTGQVTQTAMRGGRAERLGWEDMRERVMLRGLRAKFSQRRGCAVSLLDTADRKLVYVAFPGDDEAGFWEGGGGDGGTNRYGAVLEQVRSELFDGTLEAAPAEWEQWWPRRLRRRREVVPKLLLKERRKRAAAVYPGVGSDPRELAGLLSAAESGIPAAFPRQLLPAGALLRRRRTTSLTSPLRRKEQQQQQQRELPTEG